MTQITAILGEDANPSIIRQVLENMRGVIKVSIHKENKKRDESGRLMEDLQHVVNNIDISAIDINDERTRYILRGSELLSELEKDKQ